ncbi:MAG: hypothetical protein ACREIS_06955 [Nitrospiraceae bacterium]
MRLSVWIPQFEAEASPAILNLVRAAPIHVEGEGDAKAYVATFANLPQSLDLAVRLIGEVVDLPDVRVAINDRPVANLTRFWSVLICYRDSLGEPDADAYCLRRSARVSDVSGCPDRACLSHCQFICTRCLQVVHESGAPPVSTQLLAIACQAEVDWCPNLKLP